MPKRVLVTGGTGFIGSALVRALVARGDNVRTFDNDWRGSRSNLRDLESQIEIVPGDIRNRNQVSEACRGMDVVCHLASVNGTRNFYEHPGLVLEVGVKGILNVLDAAKEHQVSDLFVMSSSEVYQSFKIPTDESVPLIVPDVMNPRFSYGASKIISEMLGLHTSVFRRTCVVRPHNVYGPCMGYEHVIPQFTCRLLASLKEEDVTAFPIQGDGSETRAFCYIDDFVDGFLCVMEAGKNREIYHLGTDEETTIQNLAKLIAAYFDKAIDICPTQRLKGSTARRCPDISKIRRLGFSPRTSLEKGLRLTIPWYVKNPQETSHET